MRSALCSNSTFHSFIYIIIVRVEVIQVITICKLYLFIVFDVLVLVCYH